MSDQYIVENCSPTLAGLKTGNLFSVKLEKGRDICAEIRALNKILRGKGLCAVPVRMGAKSALVYLYRPDFLERDLQDPDARQILRKKGYACGNASRCLAQLVQHLKQDGSFPHEIGLFLGYPPADVQHFMESPWKGVKCTGCWKAYGNEREAEKTFAKFRKCTDVYRRKLAEGRSLAQLTVRTAKLDWKKRNNKEKGKTT